MIDLETNWELKLSDIRKTEKLRRQLWAQSGPWHWIREREVPRGQTAVNGGF